MAAAAVVIPPFRYATVEDGVFRGAYPTLKNHNFLRRLRLRTIVSLTPEPPIADLAGFCGDQRINLVHMEADKPSDSVTLPAATVARVLEILIDPAQQPVYVHCLDGTTVTGLVCMCLRKLQNWSRAVTQAEFCRFTRTHSADPAEVRFVDEFAEEVSLAGEVPHWLWFGASPWHATIPLLHVSGVAAARTPALNRAVSAAPSAEATAVEPDAAAAAAAHAAVTAAAVATAALEDAPSGPGGISRSLVALDLAREVNLAPVSPRLQPFPAFGSRIDSWDMEDPVGPGR